MTGSKFRVGLIQTRAARSPAANVDAVAKLIGEAKESGAEYVQTPEMTNVMEIGREKLFAAIVAEEDDLSLATFRELARKLSIYLHIGSLAVKATSDKAANRAFLIDPHGEIVARYDKIHMFDVDLAGGESYRESRSYSRAISLWFTICHGDGLASPSATTCVSRRCIAHWPKQARAFSLFRPPSRDRPARRTGTCSTALARSRTAAMCWPQRKAASTRTAARPSGIRWWSIRGAALSQRAAPSPA